MLGSPCIPRWRVECLLMHNATHVPTAQPARRLICALHTCACMHAAQLSTTQLEQIKLVTHRHPHDCPLLKMFTTHDPVVAEYCVDYLSSGYPPLPDTLPNSIQSNPHNS